MQDNGSVKSKHVRKWNSEEHVQGTGVRFGLEKAMSFDGSARACEMTNRETFNARATADAVALYKFVILCWRSIMEVIRMCT